MFGCCGKADAKVLTGFCAESSVQELRSNENADIYATTEPQELYHKRIQFCLNIHNEAVQAMSYPEDTAKEDKDKVGLILRKMLLTAAGSESGQPETEQGWLADLW